MASNTGTANRSGMNFYLRVTLSLVISAAAVALMLSVVNLITAGRIEENRRNELTAAMNSIFPKIDGFEEIDGDFEAPVKTVYSVGDNRCVVTAPKGFAGEIELMVGITADGEVAGISILDSSETPGIGTKIEGEYLDGFTGLKGSLILGANVDAISGATYSSKAVIEGVNSALNAVKSLETADADEVTESESTTETASETEPTETTAEAAE